MTSKFGHKEWFAILISIIFLTNLAILLDAPFIRPIIGSLFLTILPGLLITQILKLNEIGFTEKFVLSVGLSISFLMFFGLLINNLSLYLGYETPLATTPLLVSFNLAFIVLAIIGYKLNKSSVFFLPNFNLTISEKAFLIVPILFPALSIFGMHIMNTTDNNIILVFLLFLIPAYVIFVCFFNQKFSKRIYPVVIFLISISFLLMASLRSNHIIIGSDTGREFYFFQTTLNNLHWSVFGHSTFDACLSISLLPTIYKSILNISPEFLFKILYSLICSIYPLVIYILSKRYIGESYAFLASCFFMLQSTFLMVPLNARTNIAVLFFALAMMTLFNDNIDALKKRILFIVFMASCMVSHYSTTYIFFIILLGSFLGIEILSKKYIFKKVVSLTMVILFFSMIFFWYSQVTETAFNTGVDFIENTINSLNTFFLQELKSENVEEMFGIGLIQKNIPHKIKFVFSWLTLAFIGIGIITLIRRYKEMSFPELDFKKPNFLKEKFEVGYFVIALACSGLLVATVALPYVSLGYSMNRLYCVVTTILSVFFVIGGIMVSKNLSLNLLRKVLSKTLRGKKALLMKQREWRKGEIGKGKENGSQVRAYLIILLVLIPYFLCVTGITYQMFGEPHSIILNSYGEVYNDGAIIHDQCSYASKWIANYVDQKEKIHTRSYAGEVLMSQGMISQPRVDIYLIPKYEKYKRCDGYVYLRYRSVANIEKYPQMLTEKNKIYTNSDSEVYN